MTRVDSKRIRTDLAVCVASLALADLVISAETAPSGYRLDLLAHLLAGPFVGWPAAWNGTWELVGPATVLVLLAFAGYAVTGSRAALAMGAMLWFVSGWYFAVGMWV